MSAIEFTSDEWNLIDKILKITKEARDNAKIEPISLRHHLDGREVLGKSISVEHLDRIRGNGKLIRLARMYYNTENAKFSLKKEGWNIVDEQALSRKFIILYQLKEDAPKNKNVMSAELKSYLEKQTTILLGLKYGYQIMGVIEELTDEGWVVFNENNGQRIFRSDDIVLVGPYNPPQEDNE